MNHQLRGQSPRGNPHRVSLVHALHIWEGQPLTQNTPSRARFDSASHPFRGFYSGRIFQKSLCTSLGGFGRGRVRVWEQSGGKYTTCSVPVAPVVMSCRATHPRCFGCGGGCRLQQGVYLQYSPLLQTAGCRSPDSPPPDQDCMRALTHGECDQLKLCWARIPGVGGGWQRHDRNGFGGRGVPSHSVSSGQLGLAQVSGAALRGLLL